MIKNDHIWRLTMKKGAISILTAGCLLFSSCTGDTGLLMTIFGIPALIGALVGAGVSAAGKKETTQIVHLPYYQGSITLDDVKKMAQSGVSDEQIIHTLITTHTHFPKSELNAGELRMSGISQKVIDTLYRMAK